MFNFAKQTYILIFARLVAAGLLLGAASAFATAEPTSAQLKSQQVRGEIVGLSAKSVSVKKNAGEVVSILRNSILKVQGDASDMGALKVGARVRLEVVALGKAKRSDHAIFVDGKFPNANVDHAPAKIESKPPEKSVDDVSIN